MTIAEKGQQIWGEKISGEKNKHTHTHTTLKKQPQTQTIPIQEKDTKYRPLCLFIRFSKKYLRSQLKMEAELRDWVQL